MKSKKGQTNLINSFFIFIGIIIVAFFSEIILWATNTPSYLIPMPSDVISSLWSKGSVFIFATVITISEGLSGLIIAIILSLFFAIVFSFFSRIEQVIKPFLIMIQATPILAFAPFFIIWFGPEMGSKIACAFIVSFFPIIIGFTEGLNSPSKEELDLFKSFNFSKWQILYYLRFPRGLPKLFSSIQIALPIAILGAIIGEFIGSSEGIGFEILSASYYLRVADMFAAIFLCSAITYIFYILLVFIDKRICFWKNHL